MLEFDDREGSDIPEAETWRESEDLREFYFEQYFEREFDFWRLGSCTMLSLVVFYTISSDNYWITV